MGMGPGGMGMGPGGMGMGPGGMGMGPGGMGGAPPLDRERGAQALESGATSSERWRTAALLLGAIAMAVLAFAVTRSCLHQEPRRAPAPVAAPG
ncbi:MAG: hypothetical protein IPI49_31480 [Myxococcales bacterium]|nr:hypothetical protein [Myxococcales bacterium]